LNGRRFDRRIAAILLGQIEESRAGAAGAAKSEVAKTTQWIGKASDSGAEAPHPYFRRPGFLI
jgi:hypothetical protein